MYCFADQLQNSFGAPHLMNGSAGGAIDLQNLQSQALAAAAHTGVVQNNLVPLGT